MSVYVFCQALAETSTLLKRLQTDARMYTLYTVLLPLDSGPFHLAGLDPEELRDYLEHLAQTEPNLFSTPEAVTQTLEELRREIREACDQYPGVESRMCFVDKTYEEIYERLAGRLAADRQDRLLSQLPILFSGDEAAMAPYLPSQLDFGESYMGASSIQTERIRT